MKMSILKEIKSIIPFEYDVELMKEEKTRTGMLILKGVLQKADTLNQNGRIYPRDILAREVRNYQKFIVENRATGELDHPDSSVVSLKNACHLIKELWMEDDTVYGRLKILTKVPTGKIVEGLIDEGVKLGISSRGVGSTKKDGEYDVVQDDYNIIAWDVVSDPSTSGAFVLPESYTHERQVESLQLRKIFNRSDRIDRIMNEILFDNR